MVTYVKSMTKANPPEFEFKGLSSDTKPTDEIDGVKIGNGSSFFEMDTQNVKFYDISTQTWV